jgi:hypothetical protein
VCGSVYTPIFPPRPELHHFEDNGKAGTSAHTRMQHAYKCFLTRSGQFTACSENSYKMKAWSHEGAD